MNTPASRFRQVLLRHVRQVKGRLLVAAFCMLGVTLAQLLAPWPLKIVIDHILLGKPLPAVLAPLAVLLEEGKIFALMLVSLSVLLIALVKGVFSYGQIYITARLGYELAYALRRELFAHLQRLSLAFHNRERSGELLTKVTADTNALKDTFGDSGLTLAAQLLTLVSMLAVMAVMNWELALVVLTMFPVLAFTLFSLYRKLKDSARKQRGKEGKIASRVSEILTAVSMVQVFGREDYEVKRFETDSARTLKESVRTARIEAAAARTVEVISAAGSGIVLLYGGSQVLKGAMLPGELLIFVGYLTSMFRPIRNLAMLSNKFSKAGVSAERVAEILEEEPEIKDSPDAREMGPLMGEIAFHNVSFAYADGKAVLKDISFVVAPGQTVALVGGSGAGKSTIASLILRLYEPQQGRITIGGVDLRRYRIESLRRQIGIVLQDSVLFGATIKENIAYGKPDATSEDITAAAKLANAHEFIEKLKDGYDAIIGERGESLSGGERQRIAIAMALIRDSPILILDEPMRGLDAESEVKIRQALRRLMAGKTCLLITHDLTATAAADQILVLEEGRIIERGTPEELSASGRRYRQLRGLKLVQPEGRTNS